jgi:uncharacterized phiE125 gp8 family phage protein
VKITILTPPTAEPLSLAEARAHLRIDTFDDDGALAGFILAARQHIESETGVALCTRTLLGTVDDFPAGKPLSLPVHPVQSVTAVRYHDTAGSLVTWSSAQWEADLTGNVPRIAPRNGFAWPTPAKKLGAVQVEFVAGYGGPELVPQPVMQAMRLLVGHWYENREAVNVGNIVNAYPMAVSMLLADYRAFA